MTATDVIRQMMEQAFDSAVVSSSGGDSPKNNFIKSVDVNPVDFDNILNNAIRDLINETLEEREFTASGSGTELAKEAAGFGAGDALSLFSGNLGANPASIARQLAPLLGPAIIAFMMPEIVKFIVAELTKPGGVIDTRFRREIPKEQLQFYDRQLQYDTGYGYRNVIIQGVNGFKMDQGSFHASTFRDINEGFGTQYRLSRIGLTDKALGVRDY
jgi:hypothetical protein